MSVTERVLHRFFAEIALTSSRVVATISGALLGLLVARILGPHDKAIYSLASLGILATSLVAGGLSTAFAYAASEPSRMHRFRSTDLDRYMRFVTVPSLVAVLASVGLRAYPVAAMFSCLPPVAYVSLLNGVCLGMGDITGVGLIAALPVVLSLAFGLVLISVDHFSATTSLLAVGTGYLITWIFITRRVPPVFRDELPPGSLPQRERIRWQLAFGMTSAASNLIAQLNYRIDLIVVAAVAGLSSAGVYSVALAMPEVLWIISSSITTANYRHFSTDDLAAALTLLRRLLLRTYIVLIPAALLLGLAGGRLIDVVYGQQYSGATTPMRLALIGIVLFAAASPLAAFATNHLGRPSLFLIMAVSGTAVTAALTAMLYQRYELAGAAIATTVGYGVSLAVGAAGVMRLARTRPALVGEA